MNEDTARRIRELAVAALARREHSHAELQRKLSEKGFADPDIDVELSRLVDERLLDDSRFAESYIHYRVGRGYGPVRIRAELRQRGVADALSAALFDRLEIDWDERIAAAWRKKFGRAAADFRERAKQARFLQYRGFTPEQIARVLDAED